MATYYVRTDGNDANTGLGPGVGQAWQTITKAVGVTGITSGDTLYVAPGTYRSATGFTIATSYSSATQILADPLAAQFAGVSPGPVRLSVFTPLDTSAGTTASVLSGTTNNVTISDFEVYAYTGFGISITGSVGIVIQRCVFLGASATNKSAIQILSTSGNTLGTANKILRNIVFGFRDGINAMHSTNDGLTGYYIFIQDNFICGCTRMGILLATIGNFFSGNAYGTHIITNNFIACIADTGIYDAGNSNITTIAITCANNLFVNCTTATSTAGGTTGTTQANSRIINCANNGAYPGTNQQTTGIPGIDVGQMFLHNLGALQFGGSTFNSPNAAYGTNTNALATDLFNKTWTGATPDAGAITYSSIAGSSFYLPTERNASAITIAPASTSQSIELYLGATGLTFATSGLAAIYNKNRTSDVAIPLVARTIAQPWIAGGFAEVNSTTMPGVYRLDIPNEAIATGYVNTTIVVRGASGTNGAVVTIQEPQAVGTQLRMGPFTVQADGILTDDRLKLIQGSVHSIDFKMVDAYGTGVDGTGTVVTAKVYNAAGFLIDTYTCTAMYALDGRYSFAIDSTVTDNVGMYTINIYRQIGTETNVFGRMKLEVLSP